MVKLCYGPTERTFVHHYIAHAMLRVQISWVRELLRSSPAPRSLAALDRRLEQP